MAPFTTEFARELKLVDGRYKVVNGLGEFLFELHADVTTGVIDMLAGPDEDHLLCFPTRVVPTPTGAAPSPSPCSRHPANPMNNSQASTPRCCASSTISSDAFASLPTA